MDCDLQDRPNEIPNLHRKALEGFDAVQASRKDRQDSFSKVMVSKIYFSVLRYFTDVKFDSSVANFGIFSRIFRERRKAQYRTRCMLNGYLGILRTM